MFERPWRRTRESAGKFEERAREYDSDIGTISCMWAAEGIVLSAEFCVG